MLLYEIGIGDFCEKISEDNEGVIFLAKNLARLKGRISNVDILENQIQLLAITRRLF